MEAFEDVAGGVAKRDGTAVRAVGRMFAAGEFREEPFHFLLVEAHVDFDGGAAGDGGADVAADFVERCAAELALGGLQDLEDDLFDIAGLHRGGRGGDGDGAVTEGLAVETAGAELVGNLRVFDLLAGGESDNHGHQKCLLFNAAGGALAEHLFKENAFVGDVLVNDPEAIAAGGEDKAFVELAEGAEVLEDVEGVNGIEDNAIGQAAVGVGDAGSDG